MKMKVASESAYFLAKGFPELEVISVDIVTENCLFHHEHVKPLHKPRTFLAFAIPFDKEFHS